MARMWTDEAIEAAKPVVGNESIKTLRDRDIDYFNIYLT